MENSMIGFVALLAIGGLGYFVLARGLIVGWSQIQEKVSCAGSVMGIVFFVSVIALFMVQSMKVFFAPMITYAILYAITAVLIHGKKLFSRRKLGATTTSRSEEFLPVDNHKQEEREAPSSLPPPVQSQASGGFFNPPEDESPFR